MADSHAEREDRLREMGLTPIWRVRGPAAADVAPGDAVTAAAMGAAGNAATPAAMGAAGNAATPVSESAPLAPMAARERPAEPALQFAPSPAQGSPGNGPAVVPIADARATQIAGCGRDELDLHIAACTACALSRTRRKTVPGVGVAPAGWMFVGEGPGAEEDAQGEPFVGQAGRLLDNMLLAIGLRRTEGIYITNVVKCRPPNNRNPEPQEIAQCAPYLERQIALVQPRLLVALGRFAAQALLATDAPIGSLRGRVHAYRGTPLIVTYHPAYLLRTLPDKAKAWEDLVLAKQTFARLQSTQQAQS